MATFIRVDDHGLGRRLENLSSKQLIAAERKGITNAVKLGRTLARGGAPVATGAGRRGIVYQTRSKGGGVVIGRVFNKVYYMRFQAHGTGGRYTRSHAYRGVLHSVPFMQDAADKVDASVVRLVDHSVGEALRAAGVA